MIAYRLLGPVGPSVGGVEVDLGGAKQRALLTLLLLHANETVGEERLIDDLWGPRPPDGARNTLQVYVSRLRKALGGGAVETSPAGYVIRLDNEQLDLGRFRRLAAAGGDALARGDVPAAARDLAAALALWQGPVLGDVASAPFAHDALHRLEEERVVTYERRVDADLAAGAHAELVGELEGLVAEHPFRERFRGQLMLALYRSGRQAEALEAYREARATFVEELGIELSPALQRLEQAILRQDDELEAPERAPASSLSLPVSPTPLLGRGREVSELVGLLSDPGVRLVTLTGPGGIGKTRLALAAAAETGGALGGGAFVPLAPIREPELVPSTIAAAIGAVERPGETALDALAAQLRDRRLLLVLDNFEQLLPAAPMLAKLLEEAPDLKLLVTSRAVLRLGGEHVFEVPPLEAASALELFAQRARAAKPGFEPDASAIELCARLDNLPLALELAAARTKLLAPKAMLERLEHRFELLGGGRRDAPERQQTLRTTIDWSYELLDAAEQRLFARLAVFVGGWTLEAAEAVCEADLDTLAQLVDKSLVRESGGRFSMLETLREYARERFDQDGVVEEARPRHATFFLELAQGAETELDGPNQLEWLERLEVERGNVRACMAHLQRSSRSTDALALAAALRRFWQIHGPLEEGRAWLEAALADAPDAPPELRSRGFNGAGMMAAEQGDLDAAERHFQASLALARAIGDPERMQGSLGNLGNVAAFRGDFARARAYCEESLQLARAMGGRSSREAIVLENLASIVLSQGDLDGAIELLRESYAAAAAWGAPRQRASGARTLARALLIRGELDEASALTRESLALTEQIGESHGTAECLETAAGIAAARGGHKEAAHLFGAADALRDSIGARRHLDIEVWYRSAVNDVRVRLGEAYEAEYERGRALDFSEVLALAGAPA